MHGAGETSADYLATPPFLSETAGKPNVIISLDTSGSMKIPAYGQSGVKWDRDLHTNFDSTYNYYGYFDPTKYYSYDTHPQKRFFIEDPAGNEDPR